MIILENEEIENIWYFCFQWHCIITTLQSDLHKLLPGDEAVVVEVDPPEGELHPVLGVGRHLGAAAQEPAAALTMLNSQ